MAWQVIAKEAATYAVSRYEKEKEAAERAREIARALRENNAVILQGVADILKKAFSEAKLRECNNTIASLTVFMDEYITAPEEEKLNTISNHSQFVLDILDDDDIKLVGVPSWIIAANLRILVLQEKSIFNSAELVNARNRARDYSNYVNSMIPPIEEAIRGRYGDVKYCVPIPPGSIPLGPCTVGDNWCYSVDGEVPWDPNWPSKEDECLQKRENEINSLCNEQVDPMREIVKKWSLFGTG